MDSCLFRRELRQHVTPLAVPGGNISIRDLRELESVIASRLRTIRPECGQTTFRRFLLWLSPSPSPRAEPTTSLFKKPAGVMDPESNLDVFQNIGIRGKKIAAISAAPLRGPS